MPSVTFHLSRDKQYHPLGSYAQVYTSTTKTSQIPAKQVRIYSQFYTSRRTIFQIGLMDCDLRKLYVSFAANKKYKIS